MPPATVTATGPADLDALLDSVAALFHEDAGEHDHTMDLDWPARDGTSYYDELLADPDALLALAWHYAPQPASAPPEDEPADSGLTLC